MVSGKMWIRWEDETNRGFDTGKHKEKAQNDGEEQSCKQTQDCTVGLRPTSPERALGKKT